jgi:diguanylate cyclase (GGDEF)-like protein
VAEGREPTTGPIAAFTSAIMALVALRMLSMVRQINRQATTDDLTGLPNRRALQSAARARLADPRERQALLLLDLDRFKEVNDSLGHAAGDELLVQVTARLRSRLRTGDLLVRLGGDEFAVLLDCPGVTEAEIVARDLVAVLGDRFPLEDLSVQTGASVGVALFPDHGTDLSLLMRRADAAMYRAKQDGLVHVHDDPDMDDRSGQLRLVEEFRSALGTGQIVLHYQPKVDLTTGRVVGVEALVRWQHPTRGLLYPDAFLELVEAAGLMRPMTEEVLSTALDQVATWRVAGRAVAVAVNLSPSILVDVTLPDHVAVRLAERRLPASALELEITEESLMADRARARKILSALRDHGVKISVDDFGTGYSSLAYLRDLPIDELKLDKSFVLPMSDDPRAVALVTSTIGLAHSLGLRMVAEGVENGHVYRTLARVGCDEAQGYHLAKPLPADELELWFARREQDAKARAVAGR